MRSIEQIINEMKDIENQMQDGDFWLDKDQAQKVLLIYQDLKKEEGLARARLKSNAILTIYAGAGGDDAEDFVRMLNEMYVSYLNKNKFKFNLLDMQESKFGFRSISYEVSGNHESSGKVGAFGILQNESGVHRLVRLSPFNAKHTRETSFALVDIVPLIENIELGEIKPDDLEISFSKSSGPGGQNVNKRETAVRITHIPTGITVHVSTERSQEMNREKAMKMLYSKLMIHLEKLNLKQINELSLAGKIENEWGSQIRNYVLHPYKQVKDLRTGIETSNIDGVLAGDLDIFIVREV